MVYVITVQNLKNDCPPVVRIKSHDIAALHWQPQTTKRYFGNVVVIDMNRPDIT